MGTVTLIDKGKPRDLPPQAASMAAHLVTVSALVMALAERYVATHRDDDVKDFFDDFAARSERMSAQYTSPAVDAAVTENVGRLVAQLKAAHERS